MSDTHDPKNRHRLKLSFEDGSIGVKLICPDTGCQPINSCGECGQDLTVPDGERCEMCDTELAGECWLAQWVEAEDPAIVLEWLSGEAVLDVNGIFDTESPQIEILP